MLSQLFACGLSRELGEDGAGELGVAELELRHQAKEPLLVLPVGLLKTQDVGIRFLEIYQMNSVLMAYMSMVSSAWGGKYSHLNYQM